MLMPVLAAGRSTCRQRIAFECNTIPAHATQSRVQNSASNLAAHPRRARIMRDLCRGHCVKRLVADRPLAGAQRRLKHVDNVAAKDGPQRLDVGLAAAVEAKVDVAQAERVELGDIAVGVPAQRVLS